MSEFKFSTLFLLILILFTSCSRVEVKRSNDDLNRNYRKVIVFLDHTGDTIIKCQSNEEPKFNVERLIVGKDSKTYYINLDSTEYLELSVESDILSEVTWQIRQKN